MPSPIASTSSTKPSTPSLARRIPRRKRRCVWAWRWAYAARCERRRHARSTKGRTHVERTVNYLSPLWARKFPSQRHRAWLLRELSRFHVRFRGGKAKLGRDGKRNRRPPRQNPIYPIGE